MVMLRLYWTLVVVLAEGLNVLSSPPGDLDNEQRSTQEQDNNFPVIDVQIADMDDFKVANVENKQHSSRLLTRIKRLSRDHSRLCEARESFSSAQDFFKGRFSVEAVFHPRKFKRVVCLRPGGDNTSKVPPQCMRNTMDCIETKSSLYFTVVDPSQGRGNCNKVRIAKLKNVPVECSCVWPNLQGPRPVRTHVHAIYNQTKRSRGLMN